MLVRRCAWHRHYRGYPAFYGIARWGGLGLGFTDGVCRGCAERLRGEFDLEPPAAAWPRGGAIPLPSARATFAALALVLGSARSLDAPPAAVATAGLGAPRGLAVATDRPAAAPADAADPRPFAEPAEVRAASPPSRPGTPPSVRGRPVPARVVSGARPLARASSARSRPPLLATPAGIAAQPAGAATLGRPTEPPRLLARPVALEAPPLRGAEGLQAP